MNLRTDDLDAAATLAAVQDTVSERRGVVVRDLLLMLRWADLHADDPRDEPDAVPLSRGGDRLITLGGHGTPGVRELCLAELAIARHTTVYATRATLADALDLRHRLPATWAIVLALSCEPWVALKVARTTRRLSREQVRLVDAAVAAALAGQSPGRVLAIAEAKTIEADPEAHQARLEEARRARGVWLGRTDPDPTGTGTRTMFARIEPGDAVWVDATIERIAAALLAAPDTLRAHHHSELPLDLADLGHDELRALAFGWLARPTDTHDLLAATASAATAATREGDDGGGVAAASAESHESPGEDAREGAAASTTLPVPVPVPVPSTLPVPVRPHHQAVLYLHLHQTTLTGTTNGAGNGPGNDAGPGVARVEGIGPMLLSQLTALLGHAHVSVKPVINLDEHQAVNAYEFPTRITERTRLRCTGEVFPHATNTDTITGRYDHDHPQRFDPGGPPGQTGDHNCAPLTRTHHRAKTHAGYTLEQTDDATYVWSTPHGLHRLVDRTGTHDLTALEARNLIHPSALETALRQLIDTFHAHPPDP